MIEGLTVSDGTAEDNETEDEIVCPECGKLYSYRSAMTGVPSSMISNAPS